MAIERKEPETANARKERLRALREKFQIGEYTSRARRLNNRLRLADPMGLNASKRLPKGSKTVPGSFTETLYNIVFWPAEFVFQKFRGYEPGDVANELIKPKLGIK